MKRSVEIILIFTSTLAKFINIFGISCKVPKMEQSGSDFDKQIRQIRSFCNILSISVEKSFCLSEKYAKKQIKQK